MTLKTHQSTPFDEKNRSGQVSTHHNKLARDILRPRSGKTMFLWAGDVSKGDPQKEKKQKATRRSRLLHYHVPPRRGSLAPPAPVRSRCVAANLQDDRQAAAKETRRSSAGDPRNRCPGASQGGWRGVCAGRWSGCCAAQCVAATGAWRRAIAFARTVAKGGSPVFGACVAGGARLQVCARPRRLRAAVLAPSVRRRACFCHS